MNFALLASGSNLKMSADSSGFPSRLDSGGTLTINGIAWLFVPVNMCVYVCMCADRTAAAVATKPPRLQRPSKVSWEHALFVCALLDAHQPAFLLILLVLVLDHVDRVTDLEAELVDVLPDVLVGGLHSVQDTRW